MNTKQIQKLTLSGLLTSTFIVILCFSSLVLGLSILHHTSFISILLKFTNSLYIPEKNLFKVNKITEINPYLYIYLTFGISIFIGYVFKALFYKKFSLKNTQLIFSIVISTFILTVGLQTIHHFHEFSHQCTQFHKKPVNEKIAVRFENAYNFAQYCHHYLPGKHWGEAITDKNLQETQAMLTYAAVRYYLYPIDIFIEINHPKDCLVVFLKKNPLSIIPKGFKAMDSFDKMSLIATKE